MMPQRREDLREELTRSVEQSRASYQRLKTADQQVKPEELFQARADYEEALVRLSGFFAAVKIDP